MVARLQRGVRNAPHMPQLHYHLATTVVDGAGHFLPAIQLLGAIQAGHVGIALALRADGRGLGDDEASTGTLAVVLRHHLGRHGIRGPVARDGGHHDAIGQAHVTHMGGRKQGGRHRSSLSF